MARYSTDLTLTILGPFLTSDGGVERYGLDRTFRRDRRNLPMISASHIKGKLRMAMEELASVAGDGLGMDIGDLFGEEAADGVYTPKTGRLRFTDFALVNEAKADSVGTRTRVAIHHESGTAADKLLRTTEDLFQSGSQTTWRGKVTFVAADDRQAGMIVTMLRLGISWLTNMGGEKGVGYGRLQKGWASKFSSQSRASGEDIPNLAPGPVLHLRIKALEPIMTGGVKMRRTNFVDSEEILTGGLIKGALAEALNREFGVVPVYEKLSAETAEMFQGLEDLATHYAEIRISHAFPTAVGQARPVRIPLSTVKVGEYPMKLADLALAGDPALLVGGRAPIYQIDWKPPRSPYFEGATPKKIFSTRTEIDDVSQRALEGQLFTYSSVCPEDTEGKPIEWVGDVDVSGIEDEEIRQRVKDQVAHALEAHLVRLGKQGRQVSVSVADGPAPAAVGTKDLTQGKVIVVALQTDALILDPEQVRDLDAEATLHDLYAAYWQEISRQEGGEAAFVLKDFFACQNFQGGYLYHRYLGEVERADNPEGYRPYYLTGAGSVFCLEVQDMEAAKRCVANWRALGLPLAAWAQAEYGQGQHETWQACPFVPQNGYGEVLVNMAWHWDGQAVGAAETTNSTGGEV